MIFSSLEKDSHHSEHIIINTLTQEEGKKVILVPKPSAPPTPLDTRVYAGLSLPKRTRLLSRSLPSNDSLT